MSGLVRRLDTILPVSSTKSTVLVRSLDIRTKGNTRALRSHRCTNAAKADRATFPRLRKILGFIVEGGTEMQFLWCVFLSFEQTEGSNLTPQHGGFGKKADLGLFHKYFGRYRKGNLKK
jgi:hypothetical protein